METGVSFHFHGPYRTGLESALVDFYDRHTVCHVLLPIINESRPVSLRLLDWLTVTHSKQTLLVCDTKSGDTCNVHGDYKACLSVYGRRLFDPFRRGDRVSGVVDGTEFATTVGQAHFVMWAYKRGIIDHAQKDELRLIDAMKTFNQSVRQYKKTVFHTKRPLTAVARRNLCAIKRAHKVTFDMTLSK